MPGNALSSFGFVNPLIRKFKRLLKDVCWRIEIKDNPSAFRRQKPAVMHLTKIPGTMLFLAQRTLASVFQMLSLVFHMRTNNKVLGAIVILDTIFVMNAFRAKQIPSHDSLHHKAMLEHVSASVFVRMVPCLPQHISVRVSDNSTLKLRMVFSQCVLPCLGTLHASLRPMVRLHVPFRSAIWTQTALKRRWIAFRHGYVVIRRITTTQV